MNTKIEIIEYLQNFYNIKNEIPKLNDKTHPFTKYKIVKLFDNWINALTESNIPLRMNSSQLVICKNCNIEFEKSNKEIKKTKNHFCSKSCSATFNNSKRTLSEETKQKISNTLKEKFNNDEIKICIVCNNEHNLRKQTCSDECNLILYPKLICIVCNEEHNLNRKTCSEQCYNILYPEIKEDNTIYESVNLESNSMLKTIWDITNEDFINIVNNSNSYSDILKKCGYTNLGNTNTIKKRIKLLNLSVDHFISIKPPSKQNKKTLNEVFTINNPMNGIDIKKRLINELEWKYECFICKIFEWMDKPLSLELDHINGDHSDNRLENLSLKCPNCHSQTDTFRAKNKKKLESRICNNCDLEINKSNKSGYCKNCIPKFRKKNFKKPTLQELENDLKEFKCYVEIGKKYNVSDKCIQQWIRQYNQEINLDELNNSLNKLDINK